MSFSRRGMFGALAAAPLALPAIAEERDKLFTRLYQVWKSGEHSSEDYDLTLTIEVRPRTEKATFSVNDRAELLGSEPMRLGLIKPEA